MKSSTDRVPIIAFVASSSGSGKTTLVQGVLKILVDRGYRIGTVKNSSHPLKVDREGSDSWHFSRAGAVNSVVVGPDSQVVVRQDVEEAGPDQAIRDASLGTDIVLVEGFKEVALPKIEVYREGYSTALLCRGEGKAVDNIIAIAATGHIETDLPVLPLNDPEKVCDFIEKRFLSCS